MTPLRSLRLSGSSQTKAVRSPDMPRHQKKAPTPENSNEALTLLTLQQQVLQLTAAGATLDNVLKLVHETTLYNFTVRKTAGRLAQHRAAWIAFALGLRPMPTQSRKQSNRNRCHCFCVKDRKQQKYQSCRQSCRPIESLARYSKGAPARASLRWMGLAA